jgi:hypothetical protein
MRLRRLTLPALLLQSCVSVTDATAAIGCSKQSTLPTLRYTISPEFIWFPSGVTASDLVDQFRSTNAQFQITGNGTERTVIQSRIRNFLNTPCTLHLTVTADKWASVPQSLGLINETLSSTDLMCRLALHKLGKTYTDTIHIMLSSRLKGLITTSTPKTLSLPNTRLIDTQAPSPPISGAKGSDSTSKPRPVEPLAQRPWPKTATNARPTVAGFEYNIACPRSAITTKGTGPTPLEGLKGLVMIRDCEWCQKAVTEIQNVCGSEAESLVGVGDLAHYLGQSGWSYGGSICESC